MKLRTGHQLASRRTFLVSKNVKDGRFHPFEWMCFLPFHEKIGRKKEKFFVNRHTVRRTRDVFTLKISEGYPFGDARKKKIDKKAKKEEGQT